MRQRHIVIRKTVEGQIVYNDGEFAEIQTNGIEGIEAGLLLKIIQTHRADTNDSPEEFQDRFPVGMCLVITTTTELRHALTEEQTPEDLLQ